ncbi:MAG: potassium/proton antiporter [Geminicoccaceae bacterium]
MIETMLIAILIGSGLLVLSILTSLLAFRIGAPLLLLFLVIGLLAGVDGPGGIAFDNSSGTYFIGSLALAIILFHSGFETRWQTLRNAAGPAVVLATLGVLLTAGLMGAAAHLLLRLPLPESLLLGAIVSSTDAAAVFFLLRVGGIAIRDRVRSTLEVESGSNDPMAIFLVVVLLDLILSGAGLDTLGLSLLQAFALQMGLGLVAGLAGGWLIVKGINLIELEPGLYPIAVLGGALILFAFTALLGGSGFLAVYVAGLVAGNMRIRARPHLHRFQDGLAWLAQIVMFLMLGLFATPSTFGEIALPVVILAILLVVLIRPVAVTLLLLPFGFRRNEMAFISVVGLRGAVSILLAIMPIMARMENGQTLFNAAFLIVLVSLLAQGWSSPPAGPLALDCRRAAAPGAVDRSSWSCPARRNRGLPHHRGQPGRPRLSPAAGPGRRWWCGAAARSAMHQAGHLQPDDYVYIFTAPSFIHLLDRLFANRAAQPRRRLLRRAADRAGRAGRGLAATWHGDRDGSHDTTTHRRLPGAAPRRPSSPATPADARCRRPHRAQRRRRGPDRRDRPLVLAIERHDGAGHWPACGVSWSAARRPAPIAEPEPEGA